MEIVAASGYNAGIEALLTENKLPVSDLPASLENFFVAMDYDQVIGVIGVEIHGQYGLLRSLAVRSAYRNKGIAGKLIDQIEKFAEVRNLDAIYLLTETADQYFESKHYGTVSRDEVPADIQQSSEFSFVCPQSAVIMRKII